jgi:hypothetical protein
LSKSEHTSPVITNANHPRYKPITIASSLQLKFSIFHQGNRTLKALRSGEGSSGKYYSAQQELSAQRTLPKGKNLRKTLLGARKLDFSSTTPGNMNHSQSLWQLTKNFNFSQ